MTGLDPAVASLIDGALGEVRAAPRSGAAWGKLGSVLMHYEYAEETSLAFERAEKLSPADPRWPYLHGLFLMNREPEAAISKLQRAAELCSDHPDRPRLQLAQLLAERGRTDEAEKQFQAVLQKTPAHPLALLGLARVRRTQGRLAESTNLLDRCLQDRHTAKSASAALAMVQQALGEASAAEASARRNASLPPDSPWPDPFWSEASNYRVGRKARLEDATAWLDAGRVDEALEILAQIAREYPADEECWYLTGWALNGQQRGPEAESALREHLRRSPQSAKGLSQLAVSLLTQQRYAEAIEVLEAALVLKPTWRELHSNLGYACVQLGRQDEAIWHFRDALALDPNHAPTCKALATLLSRRGENDDARRLLQRALELDPSDSQAETLLQTMKEDR